MCRFCLLLLAVLGWTTLAGCWGPGPPDPLTSEEERELQQQVQQVQEEEGAQFGQQDPGAGPDTP